MLSLITTSWYFTKKYHLGFEISFFLSAGAELIVLNNVNRTVDYSIPSPPTGYIKATYKANENIKFGNNSQLGTAIFGGIGTQIKVKGNVVDIKLAYCNDISKSKFLTLRNIESDSYFYGKFKSIQLKAGYSLSFRKKK